jgi:hypothetical protein
LQGVLIALMGRLAFPKLGFGPLFLAAIVTGIGWEVIEHTDWVLDAFRATTINAGYLGNRVLNAVCDYLFMMTGFFAAYNLRIPLVFLGIAALKLTAGIFGRDSLTLSTIQLVAPMNSIND